MKRLFPSYELSWRTDEDDRFMRGAAWKHLRQRILERDEHTCQYCGFQAEIGMSVNHIDGNPKNNDESNLEVVCSQCHMIMHSGLWVAVKRVVQLYKTTKYPQNEIIRITREMRVSQKNDEQIISFLGLEEPMPWKQDLDYLKQLVGFITSTKPVKRAKPHLTEEEQKEALSNRNNW